MTRQEVAKLLTGLERGRLQINIAQMNELLKCLSQLLREEQGMAVLRALLK